MNIGLPDDDQRRAALRFKESFHGRQRDRLMIGYQFALRITGWKKLQQRRHGSNQHAGFHKSFSV